MTSYDEIYQKLVEIHDAQCRRSKNNPKSQQMCCMWSTTRPPDVLVNTRALNAIEKAFDLIFEEDESLRIYDMDVDEAAKVIWEMRKKG